MVTSSCGIIVRSYQGTNRTQWQIANSGIVQCTTGELHFTKTCFGIQPFLSYGLLDPHPRIHVELVVKGDCVGAYI